MPLTTTITIVYGILNMTWNSKAGIPQAEYDTTIYISLMSVMQHKINTGCWFCVVQEYSNTNIHEKERGRD